MEKEYRIGHKYKDILSTSKEEDQFVSWFSTSGSGIGNSGGIRSAGFESLDAGIPAYVLLITRNISHRWYNPWEDVVDYSSGSVFYWGDAKYHEEKKYSDFRGNSTLERVYQLILENKFYDAPPLLHFTKPESGVVKFTGLCVLSDLDLTSFEDKGNPVKNYRCELSILDCEEVDLHWLHTRVKCKRNSEVNDEAPKVWRDYISGNIRKIDLWTKDIYTKKEQLPPEKSQSINLLEQLRDLTSTQFEAVVVELFKNLTHVNHKIAKTRPVGDGGFDFYGQFSIPYPIKYEIEFLGEAKRYARNSAVNPKHVSRLIARLSRGQFGIFVTTSYYTSQTQREVLKDGYPVKLLCGNDLINILKDLRLVNNGKIKQERLESAIRTPNN